MQFAAVHESPLGTKRTFHDVRSMSAIEGKAVMRQCGSEGLS